MRKIGKTGILGVVVGTMCINLLLPMTIGDVTVSQAATSTVTYRMLKGKTVKLTTITNGSKLSTAKKKKVSALTWKSKNKKIVKVKSKKIKALKTGSTKVFGYNKKKKKVITIKVTVTKKPLLTRTTLKGKVKGKTVASGSAMAWYGIPYGTTTAGANRFRAPQPVTAWKGTKSTTTKRANAVSYSSNAAGYTGTEDCLYVNVYRPYTTDKNLPVLVYLHGGGNTSGTANVDFGKMASSMGVVIVSVSYRLGAFGYLSHPALCTGTAAENSGNFALLDIRQSLVWIQNEIASFGGNAKNVTLSGFSGGARNALLCVLSPMMKGLFHKAFIMSGGFTMSTPEEGEESIENRLASLLVKRGKYSKKEQALAYIESASDQTIRNLLVGLSTAEMAWLYKKFELKMSAFPHGFTDGVVLPADGVNAISRGVYNRVPILLGSDATEFSSFALKGSLRESEADLSSYTTTDLMNLMEKGIYYGSKLQSAFYIENTASILSNDVVHSNIYAFRMMWGTSSSVSGGFYSKFVGSYHGQTRNFLLGKYTHKLKAYSSDAVSSKNRLGREALTAQMRSYLKNFMKNGNPNGNSLPTWTTWNANYGRKRIMHLDAKKKKVSSAMSSELYQVKNIFSLVKKNTDKEGYSALVNSLWAERFFMPAVTPKY